MRQLQSPAVSLDIIEDDFGNFMLVLRKKDGSTLYVGFKTREQAEAYAEGYYV